MENVAARLSNPFGIRPHCPHPCEGDVEAVFGFGDPNADVHLIGAHPGRHGGRSTGIPFTGDAGSERLLGVLAEAGLVDIEAGIPRGGPMFMSYLHMCCPAQGIEPSEAAYTDMERLFDAELRAVVAHVLMPVGARAIDHVLTNYSPITIDGEAPESFHASELRGNGFLIIPIRDPNDWCEEDAIALGEALFELTSSDFAQEADLTRFFPTRRPYLVR